MIVRAFIFIFCVGCFAPNPTEPCGPCNHDKACKDEGIEDTRPECANTRNINEHELSVFSEVLSFWENEGFPIEGLSNEFDLCNPNYLAIGINSDPEWPKEGETYVAFDSFAKIVLRSSIVGIDIYNAVLAHEFLHYLSYCTLGELQSEHSSRRIWNEDGICGEYLLYSKPDYIGVWPCYGNLLSEDDPYANL